MNNKNKDIFSFVFKLVLFGSRSMQWLYEYDSFFAGMLYILYKRYVEQWMERNSTQHYGDEDMVTSYYKTKINATLDTLVMQPPGRNGEAGRRSLSLQSQTYHPLLNLFPISFEYYL